MANSTPVHLSRHSSSSSTPLLGERQNARTSDNMAKVQPLPSDPSLVNSETCNSCWSDSWEMALGRSRWFQELWGWKNYIILVVTPLICSPMLTIGTPEARCAYSVMLMAVYWFTEAMPMGVTALLPVVLFPLLDVVKSADISRLYMTDTNMMLFGSMLVAVSIEYWDIHKRIALKILMIVGSEPRWLMLGLMLATWLLSMWISNMAAAAMMIPITEAVLQQLEDYSQLQEDDQPMLVTDSATNKDRLYGAVATSEPVVEAVNETVTAETPLNSAAAHDDTKTLTPATDSVKGEGENHFQKADMDVQEKGEVAVSQQQQQQTDQYTKPSNFAGLAKGMTLCICYASSIGGIATLTGTGPNMLMKGTTDRIYAAASLKNPINFGSWMAFAVPLSLLLLIICWVWLQLAFFGVKNFLKRSVRQDASTSKRIRQVINDEYRKLGSFSFGQILVLLLFLLLVFLWISRDVGGVAGWGRHFESVSNSLPGVLVGILMFFLPSTAPCLGSYTRDSRPGRADGAAEGHDAVKVKPLMTWEYMNRKMPWQLVLLLGGGFAISEGFVRSGLSVWIGDQLFFFGSWNQWLVLLIFCFITASATEIASNNAICSVLLPIMEELAPRIGAHPLLFVIPVTLATSLAFMLPVSTPSNAIVFTYGRVATIDMAAAGFSLNLVAVPCTVVLTKTLGTAIFGLDHVPEQFLTSNSTLAAP